MRSFLYRLNQSYWHNLFGIWYDWNILLVFKSCWDWLFYNVTIIFRNDWTSYIEIFVLRYINWVLRSLDLWKHPIVHLKQQKTKRIKYQNTMCCYSTWHKGLFKNGSFPNVIQTLEEILSRQKILWHVSVFL